MMRALFVKQMMEVFSWVYRNRKTGKNRSTAGVAGTVLLYLIIFGFLGMIFYSVADMLCGPLISAGIGWLYFALMGMIALFMGVFGSVFNTYASLYQAKDNDLLLSMPIPSGKILLARMSGVYAMGLMYELLVMIPALIAWFANTRVGVAGVVCTLLIPLVLSVLILVLSAVLGWVVALIAGKMKHKNIMTVVLSLVFIAAYYYFYAKSYEILQNILANPQGIGDRVKNILYPLYHMGLAAEGNVLSMLIFTAIIGALFVVTWLVLSHSFLRIATSNRGAVRTQYKERRMKIRSVGGALFGKELRRFLGSSNYMLNCGLGIILMIVSAGALLWKQEMIREIIQEIFMGENGMVSLLAAGAVCLFCSMNDITAPSVSLEGKNLWLSQSLPVSGVQALKAKLHLHLVLTLIPAAVLVAAVEWVVKPDPAFCVLIPAASVIFVLFMAEAGLFLNLKMPNLNWTSEIVPIKQSMCVMITLFGSWAVIAALAGLYYLLSDIFQPAVYLLCACVLLLAVSLLLLRWLLTKGAEIFETL